MIETAITEDLNYSHLFPISGKTNSVAGKNDLLIYSPTYESLLQEENFWSEIFHTTNYKGHVETRL